MFVYKRQNVLESTVEDKNNTIVNILSHAFASKFLISYMCAYIGLICSVLQKKTLLYEVLLPDSIGTQRLRDFPQWEGLKGIGRVFNQ